MWGPIAVMLGASLSGLLMSALDNVTGIPGWPIAPRSIGSRTHLALDKETAEPGDWHNSPYCLRRSVEQSIHRQYVRVA
jgi:hypothetical protein